MEGTLKHLDKYFYCSPLFLPLLTLGGYFLGYPYLFLAAIGLGFVFFEIVDVFLPRDKPYSIEEIHSQNNDGPLTLQVNNVILFVNLLVHLMLLSVGLYFAAFETPTSLWLIYAIPVGISGSISLNIVHELMHKANIFERIISRIMGALQFWGVHELEHLYRHHNNELSCTEPDHSTARSRQSVYSFIYQAIISNYINAWNIEKNIFKQKNKNIFSLNNVVIQTLGLSTLIAVGIGMTLGWNALLFFLIQAITSILVFILMTYHQHYGLTRRKKANGAYEEFNFMNVWSSDRFFCNRLFYNLPKHAHHHCFPFCRYYDLKIIKGSPIMPYGYFTMAAISLIPSVWYKLMDRRAEEVMKQRDAYEKSGALLK